MSHTPGPWFVYRIGISTSPTPPTGSPIHTFTMSGQFGGVAEQNANLKLIASAPELLRSLELLVERIDTMGMHEDEAFHPYYKRAKHVIRIARGGGA